MESATAVVMTSECRVKCVRLPMTQSEVHVLLRNSLLTLRETAGLAPHAVVTFAGELAVIA